MRGRHMKGNRFVLDPKLEWNCVASLLLHDAGVQWTEEIGVALRALRDAGVAPKDAVEKVVIDAKGD